MKKDCYIVFDNKSEAGKFLEELNVIMGEKFATPLLHPFNKKAIVPWNNEYLKKASHLLKGKKKIDPEAVTDQGWYLGYHQGFFAKASTKLEDAIFAKEALDIFDSTPNFPAYRAIFFGILASLFGVKEGLRESTKRINEDAIKNKVDNINTTANEWWETKFKEIQNDQLLKLFIDLHNQDKHQLRMQYLRPTMNLYNYKGPRPDMITAEGLFSIINYGTKNERRVFHDCGDAKIMFSCYINISPIIHKNIDVSNLSLKQQIDLVIEHYRDVIWEAKTKFISDINFTPYQR